MNKHEQKKERFSFIDKRTFYFKEIPGEKNVVRGSVSRAGYQSDFTVFALSDDQFKKLEAIPVKPESETGRK